MTEKTLRVGLYGAGGHAVNQHLPNLKSLDGVEVVAVCDIDENRARQAADEFGIAAVYGDGLDMVEKENLDGLWSVVPAAVRPTVEVAAAEKGVHLFCDKPQTLDMKAARQIDAALRAAGAMGTVCFRERYRPIWQEAKRLLADKEVVHIRFQSIARLPPQNPDEETPGWRSNIELHNNYLGWGPHAIDYSRFVSGLDIVDAQGFFCERPSDRYQVPLSTSCNFRMSNGATMTTMFLQTSAATPKNEPYFLFYYEGGYLAVYEGYRTIVMNGEVVYEAEEFQPWLELDRVFTTAIRTGDRGDMLNDFSDGLLTLAPLLAAWESARKGGVKIDVAHYMEG